MDDDVNIIKEIRLCNFRCHEVYKLVTSEQTTLILGENGCGKTSVLEGIYIAMQGKSFRSVDKEILKRGAEYYRVEVVFSDGEKNVVTYDGEKKNFLIQDRKFLRLPKKQKYPIVLFLPSDLNLIESSPSRKRDYFDRVIVGVNDGYGNSLARYNKALKQRNELLKQDYISADTMFSWNILLAKYGVEVRKMRKEVVSLFNDGLIDKYRSIAKNQDEIELIYDSYTKEISESEYLKLLEMDFERDRITGHTNFGIHKDDFNLRFNKANASGSASRGEMRSVVLALKFIEAEMIFEKTGKKPVVLLDDVFSELDKTRRQSLVDNFRKHQVILTSVEKI